MDAASSPTYDHPSAVTEATAGDEAPGAELDRRLAEMYARVLHSWRWISARRAALADRPDAQVDRRRLDLAWQRVRERFAADLDALNRQAAAYGLATLAQRPLPLRIEEELRALAIVEATAPPDDVKAPPFDIDSTAPLSAEAPVPPETPARAALHQIITLREKIPHTPRWERARKRALWRYLSRLSPPPHKD